MYQANQENLQLNGLHNLLVYADYVNILGASKHALRKATQGLLYLRKETGLKGNDRATNYRFMSRAENLGQDHNVKIGNKSFE
jgi:hypothetical protein